jgi:hypothetical protein
MEKFPTQCDLKYNRKGYSTGIAKKNARLKLQQFYFAFFALFFGCLIASVQFIREKMRHNHFEIENKKKRKALEFAAAAALEKERLAQQEALIAISFALFL